MKAVIVIFALILFSVGMGADSLFDGQILSQGHFTAVHDAIRIEGKETATATKTVTFDTIDEDQARFAPEGSYSETFTFESKTNVDVVAEKTMYLEGEKWETDKFDIMFQIGSSDYDTTFPLYEDRDHDVKVIVYLHDELSYEEMGKEIAFNITFDIK